MIHFKKVAIVGVGLIGGSIGKAIRKNRIADEVVGIFRGQTANRKPQTAIKSGAIDRATTNLREGIKDADIVIIATPVGRIIPIVKKVSKYVRDSCIITDVGSTKQRIVDRIEEALEPSPKICFVGGHPMAGSEKNGVEYACGHLFKNAPCILVRTRRTDLDGFHKVSKLWQAIGARVVIMSSNRHDRTVADISHLPHIVMCCLLNSINAKDICLSSGGLKDTTRIASSDPGLWRDIILTNQEYILDAIDNFENSLSRIKRIIKLGDAAGLVRELKKAKQRREKLWLSQSTGPRHPERAQRLKF